eukprot:108240-Amphidinium_carterae.2
MSSTSRCRKAVQQWQVTRNSPSSTPQTLLSHEVQDRADTLMDKVAVTCEFVAVTAAKRITWPFAKLSVGI